MNVSREIGSSLRGSSVTVGEIMWSSRAGVGGGAYSPLRRGQRQWGNPAKHGAANRPVATRSPWRAISRDRHGGTREGERALAGGLVRLDLVMGEAWRPVLDPAQSPTPPSLQPEHTTSLDLSLRA